MLLKSHVADAPTRLEAFLGAKRMRESNALQFLQEKMEEGIENVSLCTPNYFRFLRRLFSKDTYIYYMPQAVYQSFKTQRKPTY